MDTRRRQQIESRWQEIDRKLAQMAETGESAVPGVDVMFCRGQLLEELDELEFELGEAYFDDQRRHQVNGQ